MPLSKFRKKMKAKCQKNLAEAVHFFAGAIKLEIRKRGDASISERADGQSSMGLGGEQFEKCSLFVCPASLVSPGGEKVMLFILQRRNLHGSDIKTNSSRKRRR